MGTGGLGIINWPRLPKRRRNAGCAAAAEQATQVDGHGRQGTQRRKPGPTLLRWPYGAPRRTDEKCHYVWPGRAVQDGLPRSTNVRAASMYQASEVEQFAPGHHGYPRASEAD